jgi:hypothetical protein
LRRCDIIILFKYVYRNKLARGLDPWVAVSPLARRPAPPRVFAKHKTCALAAAALLLPTPPEPRLARTRPAPLRAHNDQHTLTCSPKASLRAAARCFEPVPIAVAGRWHQGRIDASRSARAVSRLGAIRPPKGLCADRVHAPKGQKGPQTSQHAQFPGLAARPRWVRPVALSVDRPFPDEDRYTNVRSPAGRRSRRRVSPSALSPSFCFRTAQSFVARFAPDDARARNVPRPDPARRLRSPAPP